MRSQAEAFAVYFAALTDDELLDHAANPHSLVPAALAALAAEFRNRNKEFTGPTQKWTTGGQLLNPGGGPVISYER